jgi:competence protein ComEC
MGLFTTFFLLGVCGVLVLPTVPDLVWLFVGLFIAVLLHFFVQRKLTLALLAFAAGLFWVMLFAHHQLVLRLPHQLEGKKITVVGSIVSLPQENDGHTNFLFNTKRLLKLSWYKGAPQLHPGEKWQLTVKLKRPHGFMNPGGFDYEAWLFHKKITAVGYVVNTPANKLLESYRYRQPFNHLRQSINERVQKLFPNSPFLGFLQALLTGTRQKITPAQWQILRQTGTNHLFAIAGLHVGLISGFIFFLVGFGWRRIPRASLFIPAKQVAAFFALLAAIFYSMLAGFPIQTQRALIMLSVFLGAIMFNRKIGLWSSWFLALLLVLLFNPLEVISIGFWLSFAAVFMIIFGMRGRTKKHNIWWRWGRVQWVIMIGLLPFTLWFFNEFALSSLLANIVAVPWFAFIIVPLCFVGIISLFINNWLGFLFLFLVVKNLQLLTAYLNFLARVFTFNCHLLIPNFFLLLLAIGAVILFLAPKKVPGRYFAILLILPLILYKPATPQKGVFWLTLLDAGQGLAAVVQTKNHVLVYDTGPKFSENFNAGDAVVLPYLQVNDIKKIDMLMVSHGDNDHIGGATAILQNMIATRILTSVPRRFSGFNAAYCHQGQSWSWDGISFQVLWPPAGDYFQNNNSSCVLRVSSKKRSVLLTGDIEKPVEKKLVKQYKNKLKTTIIIAPHHGSKTAANMNFIKEVDPKFVLFPIGYLNRFHFPSKIVVNSYASINAKQYDTAQDGAIIFKNKINPILWRLKNRHIWG